MPELCANLTFELHRFANQPRSRPYLVDWRRLPCTLLETARDGDWFLDIDGHRRLRVSPGEVMVIPGETRHRLELASSRLEATWALVSYRWDSGEDAIRHAGLPHVIRGDAGMRTNVLLQRLASPELESPGLGPAVKRNLVAFELLQELSHLAESTLPARFSKELTRMQPVLKFIHSRLDNHLSREILANCSHLSPTRFHSVFKDAMGLAPMEYVLQERLKRARELLLADDQPIYQVAASCGFNSAFYFCRIFRKSFNRTPGEFRKDFRRSAEL